MERLRRRAPCRVANASRNAGAGFGRRRRWGPARNALWDFVGPWIEDGARVAIVGAGNGDDLPLRRIARRAGAVTLIDLDPRAAQGARWRLGRAERAKVDVIGHDVTEGAADAIVLAALRGEEVDPASATGIRSALGDVATSTPSVATSADSHRGEGRPANAAVPTT